VDEPLAVLVLPSQLERFTLGAHARQLLAIPRVVALEPARVRTPRFMREAAAARQASRLRWPGALRLLVLYHPAQYPLARALGARHEEAELWYVPPDRGDLTAEGSADAAELLSFDELARERATARLEVSGQDVDDQSLRLRLRELEVISSRPFIREGRFRQR
jgi:hypothetical protein